MKKLIILIVLLLVSASAYSAPLGKIDMVFDGETVETQSTIYSEMYPVKSGGFFGVWYQGGAELGNPDLKIEYEMSYTPVAATFAEPSDATDIDVFCSDTTIRIKSVQPPPMAYLRFKATGNAGNTTGSTITMFMFSQE